MKFMACLQLPLKKEGLIMKQFTAFVTLLLFALIVAGCAPSLSGDVYSRDKVQKVQTVVEGEVILVREVLIEGTKSGLGGVAGGLMGAVLGSTVGGGSGKRVATVAGGIAGAVAGAAIEEGATRQKGLEITVKLDNGEVISIVQGADEAFDETSDC